MFSKFFYFLTHVQIRARIDNRGLKVKSSREGCQNKNGPFNAFLEWFLYNHLKKHIKSP